MSQSRSSGHSGARLPSLTDPEPIAEFTDYERARDLPKLLPCGSGSLRRRARPEHARLLARLRRALRAKRQRGLGGHWTYDLARHAQLLRAYRAEVAACLKTRARQ
jgi:hypothetical protein